MGCHFLLQKIFPDQGLNSCLLHWQADSLPVSHQGSSFVADMAFLTDIGYLQGIEKPGGEGMNEMGFTVGPRGENAIDISIGNIYKFLML